jgi:hypothetical protein
MKDVSEKSLVKMIDIHLMIQNRLQSTMKSTSFLNRKSRGDVPGWVLVVLMTTALVTGIWSIAAPKLTTILRNSLDAMGGIK